MSQDTWPNGSYADLADLAGRREALRQAAAMPGADPRALLDAAFAELDAAVEALTKPPGEPDRTAGEALPASLNAERSLLRAVFQHAPAALFVLEPDGTIRRANGRAGDLIGAPPGYATGKPVTAFVDLASRAAVQSQLFFYSDGVTDARSPDMQYFEDRLADELAGAAGRTSAQTTRMVQDLVARFSQDDLRDDMTIVVARVTSPASG